MACVLRPTHQQWVNYSLDLNIIITYNVQDVLKGRSHAWCQLSRSELFK